ncbi:hypothetical protein J8J40_30080, partial [Mycobacterium tuberculosis]|nr:hypothetical protein [Mycobacterium tuberculosis]
DIQGRFNASPLQVLAAAALASANFADRTPASSFHVVDDALARLLPSAQPGAIIQILVRPLFDDFGDVTGALIAHRMFRPSEPILDE